MSFELTDREMQALRDAVCACSDDEHCYVRQDIRWDELDRVVASMLYDSDDECNDKIRATEIRWRATARERDEAVERGFQAASAALMCRQEMVEYRDALKALVAALREEIGTLRYQAKNNLDASTDTEVYRDAAEREDFARWGAQLNDLADDLAAHIANHLPKGMSA